MIFLTVGTQLPFDRFVHAVDAWAAASGRDDVFAQVGPTSSPPRHVRWKEFIGPPEFDRRFEEADLVLAHAGMGSILTALARRKPLLIMPRLARLGEHRNDHQVATAKRFAERGIAVAMDERELREWLDRADAIPAPDRISPEASERLVRALRNFIFECAAPGEQAGPAAPQPSTASR